MRSAELKQGLDHGVSSGAMFPSIFRPERDGNPQTAYNNHAIEYVHTFSTETTSEAPTASNGCPSTYRRLLCRGRSSLG